MYKKYITVCYFRSWNKLYLQYNTFAVRLPAHIIVWVTLNLSSGLSQLNKIMRLLLCFVRVYYWWDFDSSRHNDTWYLKPRVHDKRLYGMGTSRGLLLIIPSEIRLRANSPCQYVNLYVGKIWFLIGPYPAFSRHCMHMHSQSPYVNQNGNADACYVCGDWLVCCAYVCSDEIRMAILNQAMDHWTPWMDPRSCSLVRWTRILRIQQHIVWDESWGST